jgi:hypothetical protein
MPPFPRPGQVAAVLGHARGLPGHAFGRPPGEAAYYWSRVPGEATPRRWCLGRDMANLPCLHRSREKPLTGAGA